MDKLDHFEGGVDKTREHLNKMVDLLNDLASRVQGIEDWPTNTVVVHDAENTNLIRVEVKSLMPVGDLGPISCDCVSGESHGDA